MSESLSEIASPPDAALFDVYLREPAEKPRHAWAI
jgi:hypothetical protein